MSVYSVVFKFFLQLTNEIHIKTCPHAQRAEYAPADKPLGQAHAQTAEYAPADKPLGQG